MVLRERLDNPMSRPVVTAAGVAFVLSNSINMGTSGWTAKTYKEGLYSPIVPPIRAPVRFELFWPCIAQERGYCKLDKHMEGRHKEGVWKAKMFRREHPFVIDRKNCSKEKPKLTQRLNTCISRIKGITHQAAMKSPLMTAFLHHNRFFAVMVASFTLS